MSYEQLQLTPLNQPITNLGYCNLKKVPKSDNFRAKFVNFPDENGRFGCLLRSKLFGLVRLIG